MCFIPFVWHYLYSYATKAVTTQPTPTMRRHPALVQVILLGTPCHVVHFGVQNPTMQHSLYCATRTVAPTLWLSVEIRDGCGLALYSALT